MTFPKLPTELAERLREVHQWCFTTRLLDKDPYEYSPFISEAAAGPVEDYVLLSHDGWGLNSYALHYYICLGPLKLFLQLAWGGVYMDAAESREHIRICFQAADRLVETVERATRAGGLKADDRLLVFGSDLYSSGWAKPGEDYMKKLALEDLNPTQALNAALDWVYSDVL